MSINNFFYLLQGIFASYVILVACNSTRVYQLETTLLILVAGAMLVSTIRYFTNLMINEE